MGLQDEDPCELVVDNPIQTPPDLPEDVLCEIFQYLEVESLKNCRLVHPSWNSSIVNRAKLLEKFPFEVTSVQEFQTTPISKKVQWIRLTSPLQSPSHELESFFTCIGSTVKKISLELPSEFTTHGNLTFWFALAKCHNLSTLFISNPHLPYLGKLTPAEIEKFGQNIKHLRIDMRNNFNELSTLQQQQFILSLRCLSKLEFINDGPDILQTDQEFADTLVKHMKRFPSALKDIIFNDTSPKKTYSAFCELLLAASEHNVNLHFKGDIDLTGFVSFTPIRADRRIKPEACQSIISGGVTFGFGYIVGRTRRIELCRNLEAVNIRIMATPSPADMTFLQHLPKLQKLTMGTLPFIERIDLESFLIALPSITKFGIYSDISSTGYQLLRTMLPNVTKLKMKGLQNIPEDAFRSLVRLEKLATLIIHQSELTNDMLLGPCENGEPAIAEFKCLKKLEIEVPRVGLGSGWNLSDVSLEGVALNRSLEHFVLLYDECMPFSENGFQAILKAGRLVDVGEWDGSKVEFVLRNSSVAREPRNPPWRRP